MNKANKVLSEITIFNKYAKYIPEFHRRESWDEICDRYQNMMISKYPKLQDDIRNNMSYIKDKKVLPSMRALQFSGAAITKNESRIYNCAYLPIDHYKAFAESMFLLLGGTGVGYSVQFQHINQLEPINKPIKERKFIISDSLEGWADAIKVLMKAYIGGSQYKPRFNYSDIRPKGARLKTAGGKAPGPRPLMECIAKIQALLESKENGNKLKPIECHDIQCYIANAVLSGGIRRSAMISLFSHDDYEMLECKYGNWWELNEQRGRSNNSIVLNRETTTEEEFKEIWKKVELSGSGEPGIYWTNNEDWGTNPCCEIALKPYQFCNLCELNVSDIESQEDLNKRAAVAAFFGTLQAGFTDFHYLRSVWRKTTEEDALIGVGMTGIASDRVLKYSLTETVQIIKDINKKISAEIGINKAARCTTIKPSGTTSCVLGTSSGIHAWHNDYYIRRMRIMKNDPLYKYFIENLPDLIEDDQLRSHENAVLSIPQSAPEGSILRNESAFDLLDRIEKLNMNWVKEGHLKGDNTNNVSATVSIQPATISRNSEWEAIGDWMWLKRDLYNGISVLPYDGGSYVQAPFEDCTKETFEKMMDKLHEINLTEVIEEDDNTTHSQEAACAGPNGCEVQI